MKDLDDTEILGILLHMGHLFSGYKEKEIADYAKGFVLGITIALELAGLVDSNEILPGETFHEKIGSFGIFQFFRGYYYSKHVSREGMKEPMDGINKLDLSKLRSGAEKEILRLIRSTEPFFVDPGKKEKQ